MSYNNHPQWTDEDMIDFHNFIFNHEDQCLQMQQYLDEFKTIAYTEYDMVTLLVDNSFDELVILKGTQGTIVHIYKDKKEAEIEFELLEKGKSRGVFVATVSFSDFAKSSKITTYQKN